MVKEASSIKKIGRTRPKHIDLRLNVSSIGAPSPPVGSANTPFDFSEPRSAPTSSTYTPPSSATPVRPARPPVGLHDPRVQDEPSFAPVEADSDSAVSVGEAVSDIQFRLPSRTPIRTLYGGPSSLSPRNNRFSEHRPISDVSSYYTPEMPATPEMTNVPSEVREGRRPSLVNPGDYMPGLPSSGNRGKAMAAGFEPPKPTSEVRAHYHSFHKPLCRMLISPPFRFSLPTRHLKATVIRHCR